MSRVEVRWTGTDGKPGYEIAWMEDRSLSGLGLRMRAAMAVGLTLEVKFKNQLLTGIVRHCQRDRLEYFVGVQLQETPAATAAPAVESGTVDTPPVASPAVENQSAAS